MTKSEEKKDVIICCYKGKKVYAPLHATSMVRPCSDYSICTHFQHWMYLGNKGSGGNRFVRGGFQWSFPLKPPISI